MVRPFRLAALFGFKFLRIFTIPAASMLRGPTVELAISDGVGMFGIFVGEDEAELLIEHLGFVLRRNSH